MHSQRRTGHSQRRWHKLEAKIKMLQGHEQMVSRSWDRALHVQNLLERMFSGEPWKRMKKTRLKGIHKEPEALVNVSPHPDSWKIPLRMWVTLQLFSFEAKRLLFDSGSRQSLTSPELLMWDHVSSRYPPGQFSKKKGTWEQLAIGDGRPVLAKSTLG